MKLRPCGCGKCPWQVHDRKGRIYHPRCRYRASLISEKKRKAAQAKRGMTYQRHLAEEACHSPDLSPEEIDRVYHAALVRLKYERIRSSAA